MLTLDLDLEGDGSWPDLAERRVVEASKTAPLRIAVLPGGMTSGGVSVAFAIELGDSVVFVETSAKLFVMAALAIQARYPDVLAGPEPGNPPEAG
jgi:hypothetical protein